jgi:hypothetical protein
VGRHGWVIKKYVFDRNAPQITDFIVVPPFLSSRNLMGGSGVRGKAGLIWVIKVFNCLRYSIDITLFKKMKAAPSTYMATLNH